MSLIIFEDDHILSVNKPSGWNTHAPGPFLGEGIYEWLKHRKPRWDHLAIIHRLDKETSGLIVFGKTSEANRSLTRQFTERAVHKSYLLLTDRRVPKSAMRNVSGLVRQGERYLSVPLESGAERAETHFQVIGTNARGTWLEANPITGKTHQIRVHAAQNGFPILGDTLYGGTKDERVFLHATSISFRHPVTSAMLKLQSNPDWGPSGAPGPCETITLQPGINRKVRAGLREAIIDPEFSDSFRCMHGASDGCPGLYLDKLGEWMLAQSEAVPTDAQRRELAELSSESGARGVYHKVLNRRLQTTISAESSPRLLLGEAAPERFTIRENGLRFEVSFEEGYSVGIFLDQRDNRRRFLTNHVAAEFPLFPTGAGGTEVLNTFSYTCGFSVAAATAGSRTTSIDLSKKYLEWGKRNFELNQLDPALHDFIYGDVFDWMRRMAKKGREFDCIVLDPPTFSRSKESGRWQANRDYEKLISSALSLLRPGGVLFASTNAASFPPEEFLKLIHRAVAAARRKVLQQHYVPQPPDFPITRAEPAYLKTVWLRVS